MASCTALAIATLYILTIAAGWTRVYSYSILSHGLVVIVQSGEVVPCQWLKMYCHSLASRHFGVMLAQASLEEKRKKLYKGQDAEMIFSTTQTSKQVIKQLNRCTTHSVHTDRYTTNQSGCSLPPSSSFLSSSNSSLPPPKR